MATNKPDKTSPSLGTSAASPPIIYHECDLHKELDEKTDLGDVLASDRELHRFEIPRSVNLAADTSIFVPALYSCAQTLHGGLFPVNQDLAKTLIHDSLANDDLPHALGRRVR